MHTNATGAQVMFTFIAERNVESMIAGSGIAIGAIALIMILSLRSLGLGLLSLVPNSLPILATYGAWAILVGTVGFSVASVAAVSLGIVVDDSVHFLTKYLRGLRQRGLSREDAVRYAFRTVGVAVVVNTIVSCLSGLHPHPLGLEWAQTGYRGARHGCSRPRRSPIPAFATRVPATFPR